MGAKRLLVFRSVKRRAIIFVRDLAKSWAAGSPSYKIEGHKSAGSQKCGIAKIHMRKIHMHNIESVLQQ